MSEEINLRMDAFGDFVNYYTGLRMELDALARDGSKEKAEAVKTRFINFSDEGSAIQDRLEEHGRETVLASLRSDTENGDYVEEKFLEAERYITAVSENIDQILEVNDVDSEYRDIVKEGFEVMTNHYDPR